MQLHHIQLSYKLEIGDELPQQNQGLYIFPEKCGLNWNLTTLSFFCLQQIEANERFVRGLRTIISLWTADIFELISFHWAAPPVRPIDHLLHPDSFTAGVLIRLKSGFT